MHKGYDTFFRFPDIFQDTPFWLRLFFHSSHLSKGIVVRSLKSQLSQNTIDGWDSFQRGAVNRFVFKRFCGYKAQKIAPLLFLVLNSSSLHFICILKHQDSVRDRLSHFPPRKRPAPICCHRQNDSVPKPKMFWIV